MCSLYNLCRIALLGCVLGLVFSGLHVRLCTVLSYYCVERRRSKAGSCIIVCLVSVACQDDWIASRMKNSAKLQLQLFTQTNESSRHLTQNRCYFRRDISYVVGDSSARSTTSSPPPPILFDSHFSFFTFSCFRFFFLIGVRAAFSHSLVRSTRVC